MRLFLTLFIGLLIGGSLIFLLFASLPSKNKPATVKSVTNQSQQTAPTTGSNQNMNQQQLNKLKQQYQQQGGLPLTATVDTVYKGVGFIIKDNTGNRIFVHWTKSEPSTGQMLTIIGKPMPAANITNELQNQPGYTQALGDFLKNQQYYVEALSVTAANESTTAPSATSGY